MQNFQVDDIVYDDNQPQQDEWDLYLRGLDNDLYLLRYIMYRILRSAIDKMFLSFLSKVL